MDHTILLMVFAIVAVVWLVIGIAYVIFLNTVIKNLRHEVAQLTAQLNAESAESDTDNHARPTPIPVTSNVPKFGGF